MTWTFILGNQQAATEDAVRVLNREDSELPEPENETDLAEFLASVLALMATT